MLPEEEDVETSGSSPTDTVDGVSTDSDDEESEELDYKTLYEASEVTVTQLRNDSRAREGQRNRTQDQEARLGRLEASNEAGARGIAQILDKLMKDDDEFADEVRKGNQAADAQTRTAGAAGRREVVMNSIMDIVQVQSDDEGTAPTTLISKANQEKLASLWDQAVKTAASTGNEAPMHRVQLEATKMVLEEEQAKSKKALSDERAKSKQEVKKALEKAGVGDQDTGPARTGSGSGQRKRGTALIAEAIAEGSPLFPAARG